jgi:hypothetical protein
MRLRLRLRLRLEMESRILRCQTKGRLNWVGHSRNSDGIRVLDLGSGNEK